MSNSKTITSEVVHKNPWFEYCHDRIKRDDDSEGDYYYAKTRGSAMVVPVTEDGNLILVRQYRYLDDKNSIEFPCGGILYDESPSEAIKRELLEETGYEAGDLVKLGEIQPANGFCREDTSIYVTTDLKKIADPVPEEGFFLEVMMRRVDEFENMVKNGEIFCGQTLATWAITREYVHGLLK